jgi:hypothetical protein
MMLQKNSHPPTSAEKLAHNVTTYGRVKAADIVGAIFHHKDDLNFPNTSSV